MNAPGDLPREEAHSPANPKWFRQVLGQYPTGVSVITATQADGQPAGMVVGSFTSVSLNPPLVAFFPDRGSSSWPKVEAAGKFCVNILSAGQESVCRKLASKAPDKFDGIPHRLSPLGAPIIEDVIAWIDCETVSVQDAGDHYMVLGSVRHLEIEAPGLPLLFFQGGYGRFHPLSLAATDPLGVITEQLRQVDVARAEMESLAADISARVIATARVEHELVVAASAGESGRTVISTLVGQRLPFIPPTGSVFAAWNGEAEIDEWLRATRAPVARDAYKALLGVVRDRGYSVGLISDAQRLFVSTLERLADRPRSASEIDLRDVVQNLSYDPIELTEESRRDVRLISAPVFDASGNVAFALTLYDFPKPIGNSGLQAYIDRTLEAAARVTALLAGSAAAAASA